MANQRVIHAQTKPELSALRLDTIAIDSDIPISDPSKDRSLENRKHNTFAGLINMHAISMRSLSGLDSIIDATHLFINETDDMPQIVFKDEVYKTSYEILDHEGTQLLFALGTIKKFLGSHRFCSHSYDLNIKDAKGNVLLQIECTTSCFGRKQVVKVSHRQEIYGFLKRDGDSCTPDYILINGKDKPLLRIRPPKPVDCFVRVPVDYCIYNAEFATNIGIVRKDWSKSGLKAIIEICEDQKGYMFGAKFPRVLPVAHKILILAALFTFKFFPG